jgi:hypothetical protein
MRGAQGLSQLRSSVLPMRQNSRVLSKRASLSFSFTTKNGHVRQTHMSRNKFITCMYRVKGCPMVHFGFILIK